MDPNRKPSLSQPVMDVQRPASSPSSPVNKPQVVQPTNPALGRPATREYTRPRTDGSTPDFSGPNKFIPPAAPTQENKPRSGKAKKFALGFLVATIILLIAGVGAYLYMNMQEEPVTPAVTDEVQEPAAAEGVQATPAGVDRVIQEVDQILNSIDDTADFKPNDLSDDSLGL